MGPAVLGAIVIDRSLGLGRRGTSKPFPLARTRCRGAFDLFGSGTDAGRAHFGEPSDQGGWGSHACPDDEFDAIRCCCTGRRRQSCHWPQRKPAVVPLGQSSADHPRHPAHSNEAIVSDSLRPAHLNSQTGRVPSFDRLQLAHTGWDLGGRSFCCPIDAAILHRGQKVASRCFRSLQRRSKF